MRKSEMRQTLDAIKSMDGVCAALKQASKAETGGLLNNLDGLAARTSAFLYSAGCERTRTAELLASLRARIGNAGSKPAAAMAGALRGLVNQISIAAKKELSGEGFEVLFIVARADLWDAFETVWKAAVADPDCDVYVMPVPYSHITTREKHGDKPNILGDWLDEADKMPTYVPVTDWREYDIEKRRPNAVFTQWPYEDNANLMVVHRDYYSDRLTRFSDAHYWIPYHVLPVDNDFELWAAHIGSLNTKRVFLQSEQARQKFIKGMREYERVSKLEGWYGNAEEKAVALGSPKFDRIITGKPDDFDLPDKWRKLIYRPDGTKKTVVLYNTHCSGSSLGTPYIKKLAEVVGYFANREDVVLWWRPHPMLKSALTSNEVEYKALYDKIVNKYKELAFGIWDDTPDLHRAMCLSDIYYGDGSSLVALSQCKGMPILFQDTITPSEMLKAVRPIFLKDDGERVWFVPRGKCVLLYRDKATGHIGCAGRLPDTDDNSVYYSTPTLIDGKLYFAPEHAAETLPAYDINAADWRSYPISEDILAGAKAGARKFAPPVKYKDNLYYVGCGIAAIIKLDPQTGRTDYFTEWADELVSRIETRNNLNVLRGSRLVGSSIYAVSSEVNAVLEFNLDDETYKIHKVGVKSQGWASMAHDGERFWLIPRMDTPITSWDPTTGDIKEYNALPDGFMRGEWAMGWVFCLNGRVIIFPTVGNMILEIEPDTGKISVLRDFEKRLWDRLKFTLLTRIDDVLYMHCADKAGITTLNTITGEEGELMINVSDLPDIEAASRLPLPGKTAFENTFTTLDTIISGFQNRDKREYEAAHKEFLKGFISAPDGTAGAEIYNYVKGLWRGDNNGSPLLR